jgi:predicted membrane protein
MNEKELGKALLQLDADKVAAAPNATQLTQDILNRDRRRVHWLTGLTIATWIVAGLMILVVLGAFVFTVIPHVKTLTQDINAGNLTSEQTVRILHMHTVMFLKSSILIAFSVFIMAVAALFTVLLIFASRHATLRQVTANLADVSEQLKKLSAPSSKTPPVGPAKTPEPPSPGPL